MREGGGVDGGSEGGSVVGNVGREGILTHCIVICHRYAELHLHYHYCSPNTSTYGSIPTPRQVA